MRRIFYLTVVSKMEVYAVQRRISIRPRFWLFVIVLMLLCFGISCAVAQLRYVQASDRLSLLNEEKVALMDQVSVLTAQLDYVRTDAYVERVARDELNMLRPGEIRYVSN